MTDAVDVSIVIEWENALLAEATRGTRMLHALRKQILRSPLTFEILILFDPMALAPDQVKKLVATAFPTEDSAIGRASVRIEGVENAHYYDFKNAGAQRALGGIVVYIDSDVIPEKDWLDRLLFPFVSTPRIEVVAGSTQIDPEGIVGKSFALGWFFPLWAKERSAGEARAFLAETKGFYANNVAFRRDTSMRHPFPKMPPGMTRGACDMLAQSLADNGVKIWLSPLARVLHPAPNGLRHIVTRALAEGRDYATARGLKRNLRSARVCAAYSLATPSSIIRVAKRARLYGDRVNLKAWEYPLVVMLQAVYYAIRNLGAWATVIAPRWSERAWRI